MKARPDLALLVAVALSLLVTELRAQDLLQSSCFQVSFGRAGMAAEGRRIAAAELEWFDATDQYLGEAGAVRPEAQADEETRRALATLAPGGLQGRRFLAAQITVRLRGEPPGEGPDSDGAICIAADGGLRCRLLCEGAGEFTVRLDRQGRAGVRPGQAGIRLNACGAEHRRVRIPPKSGPAFMLKRENYDVCGAL
jgi:hypothetical protein